MEALGPQDSDAADHGFVLYRKTIFLADGASTLTFQTKTRDMATVMIDGVHQVPPYGSKRDLTGVGYWLAKYVNMIIKKPAS